MPSMYEIYDNNAQEYDELVNYEDYKKNFSKSLTEIIDFDNKNVVEAGTGTGRVSKIYLPKAKYLLALDRANHMLEKAKLNLEEHNYKVDYQCLDNNNLEEIPKKFNIFIEGWSFGHTVNDNLDNIDHIIDKLVDGAKNCLEENNSKIVFIETLGTNQEKAAPPTDLLNHFYSRLEKTHGFEKSIVNTDYKFPDLKTAKRVMGFFFGDWIVDSLDNIKDGVVPEWTGIWTKSV